MKTPLYKWVVPIVALTAALVMVFSVYLVHNEARNRNKDTCNSALRLWEVGHLFADTIWAPPGDNPNSNVILDALGITGVRREQLIDTATRQNKQHIATADALLGPKPVC